MEWEFPANMHFTAISQESYTDQQTILVHGHGHD